MSNPFTKSLDALRGRRVRVVSNDGVEFHGWLERWHHHDRHVALRGATNVDRDEDIGAAIVAHADTVEALEPEHIENVAVDEVEPSPFAVTDRELDPTYVREVRKMGWAGSFPTVRELEDGTFEVVEGHTRLAVCLEAGIDEHPVRVADIDDWEATRRFVVDHLALEGESDPGQYEDEQIRVAVEAIFDRWGDDALELDRVAFHADRLDLDGAGERDEDLVEEPQQVDEDQSDDNDEEEEEVWCGTCGYGPSSEIGVKRHHGHVHDGPARLVFDPDEISAADDVDEDGDVTEEVTPEKVFAELIAMVEDEERSWVKASEIADRLGTSGQKVGHRLGVLKSEGKVEKHDQNAAAVWRPVGGDPQEGEPDEASDVDDGEDPFIAASRKARQNDSGTSTEDDTPAQTSESESESEARTVDLEEDAADDSPDQDAGEDVHVDADHDAEEADEQGDETTDDEEDEDESKGFPRDCHCGATLEDSLELAVHRTEVHGVPQGTLDHLEPGEFEEIVRDADTLQDIVDATGWSSERTLRALGVYGLADVVGPDGIELSDLDDYEFEGIDQPTDTPDPEADVIDESEAPSPRPVANDGGAVAFSDYSASSGTGRRCQNCGAHVDKQFAKVFEPEHEGAPRACPNCEDLVREGDGTIRQKRTGGGA